MTNLTRKFKIDLEARPIKRDVVGGSVMRGINVELDGEQVHGVDSLCIKSGLNGYTHVVLELEAQSVINMTGALVVGINDTESEKLESELVPLFLKAMDESDQLSQLDFMESDELAKILKKFCTSIVENGKG